MWDINTFTDILTILLSPITFTQSDINDSIFINIEFLVIGIIICSLSCCDGCKCIIGYIRQQILLIKSTLWSEYTGNSDYETNFLIVRMSYFKDKGKADHYFVIGMSEQERNMWCIFCKGNYYPPIPLLYAHIHACARAHTHALYRVYQKYGNP